MKKLLKKILILPVLPALIFAFYRAEAQPPRPNVSFNVFYNELSPYGEWIQEPTYGPVWVPAAGPDFRPYHSNGHWAMTEYGNTWVSDYDWGWAPFHYGRWIRNNRYGWAWVPDSEWAPAWVAWRGNNDYYGWAPLMPILSISLSPLSYAPPLDWWSFVPPAYLYEPQWINYYPGYDYNRTFINNTTIINNIYKDKSRIYIFGPAADDVRRRGKRDVNIYKIGNGDKPGRSVLNNKTINMYRPLIDRKSRGAGPASARKAEQPFDKPGAAAAGNKNRQNKKADNTDLRVNKAKNEIRQGGQAPQQKKSQQDRPQQKEIRQTPQKQEREQPKNRTQRNDRKQQPQSRPPAQQMRQQQQDRPQRKEMSQPRQQSSAPQQQMRQQPRQQAPARQPQPQGGGGKQGGGKGKGK